METEKLRKMICKFVKDFYGVNLNPERILVKQMDRPNSEYQI